MDIKTFKVELKGDKVIQQIPTLKDKALRINLNEKKDKNCFYSYFFYRIMFFHDT
jgi:hypothetical protein